MKHAILITAYTQSELLNRFIVSLNGEPENLGIFVHIDAKSKISPTDVIARPNVHVYKKYKVNWGGFNHLQALLFLTEEALDHDNYDYIHWNSGQDWAVCPIADFDRRLMRRPGFSYLEAKPLPKAGWRNGGFDRVDYYNFFDAFNAKNRLGRLIIYGLRRAQKLLGMKRRRPAMKLYGGIVYCSLTREAADYLLRFGHENPNVLKRLRHSFAAEEIYPQSVLMNSPLAPKITGDDSLRFFKWKNGAAKILDDEDYDDIVAADPLFIRKVDGSSKNLVEMIAARRTDGNPDRDQPTAIPTATISPR